ncbi:hypothetical protein A2480_00380 [Candidatus Uhrbacteria bacterium RIFOXYC2_FULL_47_19]|uniref:Uncharacterized protein n=1 Tax=Candidatus Uhrbacteria bacterium RIFOXYC2_FULL_47_19 TaxID=1802424 RepID=A0A1F7WE80_9BACT|nr:MAG: hypothetical protein A2480_00380 [Candidatus Uhrbacteria bacterium RIFOXYC2_FULL_47_19]HCC22448.1 hypothetical protein [Candidatus Uhrbacteria bacterium]
MSPGTEKAPDIDPSIETEANESNNSTETTVSAILQVQERLLEGHLDKQNKMTELVAAFQGVKEGKITGEQAQQVEDQVAQLGGEDGVKRAYLSAECETLVTERSLLEIPAEQIRNKLGLESGDPQVQIDVLQTGLDFWERQEKKAEDPLNSPDFPDDRDQIIDLQDRSTELTGRIDQDKKLFSQKSQELKTATSKADKDRLKREMEEIDQRIEASGKESDELKNSLEKITTKYGSKAEQVLDDVDDYRQIKTELANLSSRENELNDQLEQAAGLDTLGGEGTGELMEDDLKNETARLEQNRTELQGRLADIEDRYLPPGEQLDNDDETTKEVRGEIEAQRQRLKELRQEKPDSRSQRMIESDMETVKEKIFDLESKLKTGRTIKENITETKRQLQAANELKEKEQQIEKLNQRIEANARDFDKLEAASLLAAQAALTEIAERIKADDSETEDDETGSKIEKNEEDRPIVETNTEQPSRAKRSEGSKKSKTVDKPSPWKRLKGFFSASLDINPPAPTKKQEQEKPSALKSIWSGFLDLFRR